MASGDDASDVENFHDPYPGDIAYSDSDERHDYEQFDGNLDYAADAVRALDDYTNSNSDEAVDSANEIDAGKGAKLSGEISDPKQQQQNEYANPQPRSACTIRALVLTQKQHGKRKTTIDKTNNSLTHAKTTARSAKQQSNDNALATRFRTGRWTTANQNQTSSFTPKSNDVYQTTDEETELPDNQTQSRTTNRNTKRVNFDPAAAGDSESSTAELTISAANREPSLASGTENDENPLGGNQTRGNRLPHLWPPPSAQKNANSSFCGQTTNNKSNLGQSAEFKSSGPPSSFLLENTDLGLRLPSTNTRSATTFSSQHHSSVQRFLSSTNITQNGATSAGSLDDLPACARCELLDKIHEQTVETLQQQVRELKDKNGRLTQLVDEQTYRLDKLEREKQKFEETHQDVLLGIGSGGNGSNTSNSQELLNIKAMELSRKNRELTARLESTKSKYEAALKKVEALEHQLGEEAEEKARRQKLNEDPDALQRLQDDYKSIEQKYTAAKEKSALTLNAQQMLKSQVNKLTGLLRRELGPDCDFRALMQNANGEEQRWQGRDEQIRLLKAKVEQQRKHIEELTHQKFSLLQHSSKDLVGSVSAMDDGADSSHRSGSFLSVGADARNRRHVKELEKDRRAHQEKSVVDLNELRLKSDDYKRKWQNEKSRNEYLQQQNQLLVQTNRQLTQAFEKDEKIIQQLNENLQISKKRARQLQRDESEMLQRMQRRIEQIERQTQLDMMQQQMQQQQQPALVPVNTQSPLSTTTSHVHHESTPASAQQPPQSPWNAEFAGLKQQINEFVELAVPLKKLYTDLVTTGQSNLNSPLCSSSNILNNAAESHQQHAASNSTSKVPDIRQKNPTVITTKDASVNAAASCRQHAALGTRNTDASNSLLEELTFVRDENAQLSRSLKDVLERLQSQAAPPPSGAGAAGDIPVVQAVASTYAESTAASSVHSGKISRVQRIHGVANVNKWSKVKSKLPSVAIVSKSADIGKQGVHDHQHPES